MTPKSFQRTATSVACLALAFAAAGLSGCGGDDEPKPPPIGSGSSNASPGSPEFGRNVVRVPGLSPEDTAASALLAVYPPEEEAAPSGFVFYPNEEWRYAATAAQFAGEPVNAAVLPTERRYFPTPILDLVERIEPSGFPKGGGLETILLGNLGSEVIVDLQRQDMQLTELDEPTAADLANELVAYRGGYAEGYSDTVVVVSSEESARDYALIAAAWGAFSGDTVAFVDSSGVPEGTRKLLATREDLRTRQPTVYAFGPESAIPDSVLGELGGLAAAVKRIPAENVIEGAIAFARYSDPSTGFGFGIDKAPASFSFVNVREDWRNLYAALILAGAGPMAPILPIDDANRLPGPVRTYLSQLRGNQPSQAYVLGDRKGISSPLIADLDALLAAKPTQPEDDDAARDGGSGDADADKDGGAAGSAAESGADAQSGDSGGVDAP